jgi:two-component system phosphate regulon response regulator OmpR
MSGGDATASGPGHLLVVDDDARIRTLLQQFLIRNGYRVTTAADAARARRLLAGLVFDLIILDVMMPGEDGIALTRDLARNGRRGLATPILLLTARGETAHRIEGLEAGADDYLTKPFDPRELLLRVSAILRRAAAPALSEPTQPTQLTLGPLRYDPARGELWDGEGPIRLTASEAALMRLFAASPGQTIDRDRLTAVLGTGPEAEAPETTTSRAIDVQITRLRRKLRDDPRHPRYLHTVRGAGYRLDPD